MQYNLTDLSGQEIDLIAAGLGELPLKVGVNMFAKVQQQVAAQNAAAAQESTADNTGGSI